MKKETAPPLLSILVGLLLLTLLIACGSPPELDEEALIISEEPTPTAVVSERGAGGTLRIIAWAAPTTLNPHLALGLKDWDSSRITYEPLASFDNVGELVPFLAAEIPSLENGDVAADGMSVTWRLRDDVFWSDGTPFTAADVRFTYEYITNPFVGATFSASYDSVTAVEIISDHVIRVHFDAPNPAWAVPFVGVPGMILPRHIFEPYSGGNAREAPANLLPIGTGPYRVVAFKPQEVLFLGNEIVETNIIIYEPNPYYREADKPYFSRIELRGGGTVNEAARSVLQDGRADFAPGLQMPADNLARLAKSGQGVIIPSFTSTVEVIELNRTDPNRATAAGERSSLEFPHPFFSDLLVRQALSLAINRERIAALYGPAGTTTSNILVAPTNFQSGNTRFEYNPTRARQLLEEAGWTELDANGVRIKDGRRFSILLQAPFNPIREQVLEMVQSDLAAIGIELELRIVDASIFFGEDVLHPNNGFRALADLQQFDILSSSPDPGPYLQWWMCEQIPQMENDWFAGFNSPRWCNPEYDNLFRQTVAELDPNRREQLFIQMNDLLIEDVVMIPLVHEALISAASLDLTGIELTGWDTYSWKIQDWKRVTP
jgi:peptide/nickel transport system substrate-binding protein